MQMATCSFARDGAEDVEMTHKTTQMIPNSSQQNIPFIALLNTTDHHLELNEINNLEKP